MKFEMALTAIIFLILFLKIDGSINNLSLIRIVYTLLFVNLATGLINSCNIEIFDGMFRTSALLVLEKSILNLATFIICMVSYEWLKKHNHLAEFFILLLSSLLGMFFMLSSNNILMFYLGLELSTIPLAALCNFDLDKKLSSEAALKMILSSAFSSGILLFGISLLYGTTGSFGFKEIAGALNGSQIQLLAFIMIFTGFAFKLSVVPFHLWTADVYEGSPVAVTAFLSVVSKGAMAFAFVNVLYVLFGKLAATWYNMLALSAILSMITGNVFALRQTNLKRFLAFSSITQVGYLLIGISSISQLGVASVIYFILIYLFSNLAAFGVISLISSYTGKETIDDYKGLYTSNPALALLLSLALFSLAGIPPTAGFFGKLFLLTAGALAPNWPLTIIASLNLIISLYYYLRIVRVMFVEKSDEPILKINFSTSELIAFAVCALGVLSVGFLKGLFETIYNLSSKL